MCFSDASNAAGAGVTSDSKLNNSGYASSDIHARSLDFQESKVDIYREWASSYDRDVAGLNYQGPAVGAKALCDRLPNSSSPVVLDAGCGTGLVGQALLEAKPDARVTGWDISPDMMDYCLARGFAACEQVDLNQPVECKANSFDGVVCMGTFIEGHVTPSPALPELCRVTKPGGYIVFSVRKSYFGKEFKEILKQLEAEVESITPFQYLEDVVADLVVVRVL